MKMIVANPLKENGMMWKTFQDAFRLASDYLGLDKYPDKTVVVMLDAEAGETVVRRMSLGKGAVFGGTSDKFDSDNVIRIMLARIPDIRTMFLTFLHELTHVAQAASGRSITHDDGSMTFEGVHYPSVVGGMAASFEDVAEKVDRNRAQYMEAPWEIGPGRV